MSPSTGLDEDPDRQPQLAQVGAHVQVGGARSTRGPARWGAGVTPSCSLAGAGVPRTMTSAVVESLTSSRLELPVEIDALPGVDRALHQVGQVSTGLLHPDPHRQVAPGPVEVDRVRRAPRDDDAPLVEIVAERRRRCRRRRARWRRRGRSAATPGDAVIGRLRARPTESDTRLTPWVLGEAAPLQLVGGEAVIVVARPRPSGPSGAAPAAVVGAGAGEPAGGTALREDARSRRDGQYRGAERRRASATDARDRPLEIEQQRAGAQRAEIGLDARPRSLWYPPEASVASSPARYPGPIGSERAERDHRRDGLADRDLGDDDVAEQVAGPDGADAGVVVGLGREDRRRSAGSSRASSRSGLEHRWKMGRPRRTVNARGRGRRRADVSACDGRAVTSSSPFGVSITFMTAGEPGVAHDPAERLGAERALADQLVPVAPGAERGLGVVEVEAAQAGRSRSRRPSAPRRRRSRRPGRSPRSRGGRCRRRTPTRCRTASPMSSRRQASSSKVLPSDGAGAGGRLQQDSPAPAPPRGSGCRPRRCAGARRRGRP